MRSGLSLSRPAGEPTTPPLARPPAQRRALSAQAIASPHQQPTQHSSPLRPSWRSCRRSRRVEHARPQGVGASRSPRRRRRRSRRSRNGGGQPRGSTRQEACQRWAAPARALASRCCSRCAWRAVSNPRMQVRSRPTATQWQWRSDRRSTVAKRGRGTTGASADGDAFTCQENPELCPM